MSISFKNNSEIYLRRGDYADFNLTLTDESGEIYELADGEFLTLTVRRWAEVSSEVLLQIQSITGQFIVNPADTNDLSTGDYSFDIQLTRANGEIHTVVPNLENKKYSTIFNWNNFHLLPEVTM